MGSCSHGGCILTWYQSAGALEQLACLDGACEVRFAAVPTTPFFSFYSMVASFLCVAYLNPLSTRFYSILC